MSLEKVVDQVIKAEILVLGSEAAGAKAAIEAQEEGADVLVVTKGLVGRTGNTVMAGKGIQAAIGHADPRDNPDVFFEDVVNGGEYLNNQKLSERLTKLSVTECTKMEKWGAKFYKDGDKFYLPVERMEFLQKYVGFKKKHMPILNKMGAKSWKRIKKRSNSKSVT